MWKRFKFIQQRGETKEEALKAINFFAKKKIPVAIASSSWKSVIEAVLKKLSIKEHTAIIHSAEEEQYGKPHPGIYITAVQKLGAITSCCLAFEDSPNGVLAAKATRLKCIAVPDKAAADNKVFTIADLTPKSLKEFNEEVFDRINQKT